MGFSDFVPIIILFFVLGIVAVVGFVAYSISQEIADKTRQKMEKKNVVFTKDGMKVGVREIKEEHYVDKTQGYFVKAWNYSKWPAYKSRFWNKEAEQPNGQVQSRVPYSRHSSSSNRITTPQANSARHNSVA